jgi:hypothetical protein
MRVPPTHSLHTVGAYVAHEEVDYLENGRIHTFAVLTYSDHVREDVTFTQIFHRDLILFEQRLQPTTTEPFHYGTIRGTVAGFPGPWRSIRIRVTPKSVWMSCDGHPGVERTAARLKDRALDFQEWADRVTPGATLEGWSTRRPLGVWVYGSTARLRNFTITPLVSSTTP